MNYIEKIEICNLDQVRDTYLNKLPVVRNLMKKKELNLDKPVTFFTGDNGAGKSTLIEAIAIAFGFNPEGGSKNFNFSTYNSHSILSKYITIKNGIVRPKDGFFLRAESFYNIASYIESLDQIKANEPLIKDFYGGKSLHDQSHGEGFLSIMLNRFIGNGIDRPPQGHRRGAEARLPAVVHGHRQPPAPGRQGRERAPGAYAPPDRRPARPAPAIDRSSGARPSASGCSPTTVSCA